MGFGGNYWLALCHHKPKDKSNSVTYSHIETGLLSAKIVLDRDKCFIHPNLMNAQIVEMYYLKPSNV